MLPIIAIVGPTGVGKTALSIGLAKHYDAEIINADSMQVYKGLNVATAKITEEEKEGIVHHLLDICDVHDNYTVYHYQKDCREKIKEITDRGKNVIIVGGTGLYLKAALYDYHFLEKQEKKDYLELSNLELYQKVRQLDPTYHEHINNRQRLVSTLNRLEEEKKRSVKEKAVAKELLYPTYFIGLTTNRKELYQKIDNRVDEMIKKGLKEEVLPYYQKEIIPRPILSGIGYKEWKFLVLGMIDEKNIIEQIKKNSRNYAKRQYTFYNHQLPVTWFNTNYNDFRKTIDEVIQFIDNKKQ